MNNRMENFYKEQENEKGLYFKNSKSVFLSFLNKTINESISKLSLKGINITIEDELIKLLKDEIDSNFNQKFKNNDANLRKKLDFQFEEKIKFEQLEIEIVSFNELIKFFLSKQMILNETKIPYVEGHYFCLIKEKQQNVLDLKLDEILYVIVFAYDVFANSFVTQNTYTYLEFLNTFKKVYPLLEKELNLEADKKFKNLDEINSFINSYIENNIKDKYLILSKEDEYVTFKNSPMWVEVSCDKEFSQAKKEIDFSKHYSVHLNCYDLKNLIKFTVLFNIHFMRVKQNENLNKTNLEDSEFLELNILTVY